MHISTLGGRFSVVSLAISATCLAGWHEGLRAAPAGAGRGPVPFQLDVAGLVLVPAALGELASETCVLDTGATRTIISDRLQARLALPAVARAPVVSSAGIATHDVVELPPVTVGEVTRAGLYATVLPAARMRAIAERAACIIGHDFLSAQDFTIDYQRRLLLWNSEPDQEGSGSTRIPLLAVEGRYIVELKQPADSQSVRLVPDSGASEIVLFRQPEPPPLPLVPLLTSVRGRVSAATGERETSAMRLRRLYVGDIELKDRYAYLVDRARDERTGVQGLLPLHLFARVSFRVSDWTMELTPR